ncbi:unnamed protein product [Darwinula stevensoni]|uniref:Uncharacterized protein n=1 Tax=Darwinula stevensoni TaxID=69355 RepID=A0A7R9FS67_9CRUS|nr:unnamed protein product [Darwinula stevensoni]CAG0903163.1 unnamed protein product [Darwinula stevensoni]
MQKYQPQSVRHVQVYAFIQFLTGVMTHAQFMAIHKTWHFHQALLFLGYMGLSTLSLGLIPTRTAPIGPDQGISDMLRAAEAALMAKTSGSCTPSTDRRLQMICVSPENARGNMGLKDRSIMRLVRTSLSVGPRSRRRKFMGMRPAAAAFWRKSTLTLHMARNCVQEAGGRDLPCKRLMGCMRITLIVELTEASTKRHHTSGPVDHEEERAAPAGEARGVQPTRGHDRTSRHLYYFVGENRFDVHCFRIELVPPTPPP